MTKDTLNTAATESNVTVNPTAPVILTRAQILEANDLRRELVPVPEWAAALGVDNAAVYVQALSGDQKDAFEDHVLNTPGHERNFNQLRARFVAWSTCDADGKPLFTDADISRLGRKSAAALDRVYEVARRLSGMTSEDMATLEGN